MQSKIICKLGCPFLLFLIRKLKVVLLCKNILIQTCMYLVINKMCVTETESDLWVVNITIIKYSDSNTQIPVSYFKTVI